MSKIPFAFAAMIASLSIPVHAESFSVSIQPQSSKLASKADRLASFTPRTTDVDQEIDYSVWGFALNKIVVGLGPSLRQGASRPAGFTGTRINRGHNSRLRLEGSRVAYSFFTPQVTASLTEYREDLERVGTQLDIASLSRNEQLAFWLNLHNVAVIEQIARNYPKIIPSSIEINGVKLDEACFIEVAGVKLSPKDIRTGIVYPNWSDPRVIYGFFRGDIGSPRLQPEEFNARNLDFLLGDNAAEFVNSLRGVERRGDILHVSKIYEEAVPFYFGDFQTDLPKHLATYADVDVVEDIAKSETVRATIYEEDIADLARGQRQNFVNDVLSAQPGITQGLRGAVNYLSAKAPLNVQRFINERQVKREKLRRSGLPLWTIRVIPLDLPGEPSSVPEIE